MQTHTSLRSELPESPSDVQHGESSSAVGQGAFVSAAEGLIDAANVLAGRRLIVRDQSGWFGDAGFLQKKALSCDECFRTGLGDFPIEHAYDCAVGKVLIAAKLLSDALPPTLPKASERRGKSIFGGGILCCTTPIAPNKFRVEQNFFAGPVRTIEYDTYEDDMAAGTHPHVATHEEAASGREEVFGEAAK